MDILTLLIPIAVTLGSGFAILFVIAAGDGQFEDLDDPALRMLQDDD